MSDRAPELLLAGLAPLEADVLAMRASGSTLTATASALGIRAAKAARAQRTGIETLARRLGPAAQTAPGRGRYLLFPEVEEGVIAGTVDPATLPPGYAEAAFVLASIRGSAGTAAPSSVSETEPLVASEPEVDAPSAERAPAPRRPRRVAAVAAVVLAFAAGSTVAAAGGSTIFSTLRAGSIRAAAGSASAAPLVSSGSAEPASEEMPPRAAEAPVSGAEAARPATARHRGAHGHRQASAAHRARRGSHRQHGRSIRASARFSARRRAGASLRHPRDREIPKPERRT